VADEIRVTPWFTWPDGSLINRIWQRKTPWGMWQAHEWKRPDGSIWREAWIPSAPRSDWCRNANPAEDPDPDPLRAALRQIADGHNDPRRLAREVLGDSE
jgi:hypothetical protein